MRTLLQILTIALLISCQGNSTKENIEMQNDNFALELNPDLIDNIDRSEYLNLENPELEFYEIAIYTLDLNNNQKNDSIILKQIKGWENDPGDFRQIEIITDNGEKWTETNFNGWVRFDNNYHVPNSVKKKNQINTDLLLITDFEKTKIIGLFGWVYASVPGLLTVIEFSSDKPRIMINRNLDLIELDNKKIITQYLTETCKIENINSKITKTCE